MKLKVINGQVISGMETEAGFIPMRATNEAQAGLREQAALEFPGIPLDTYYCFLISHEHGNC